MRHLFRMTALLAFGLLMLAGCSSGPIEVVGGSGTEGGNVEIVGALIREDGSPAAAAEVRLYPSRYDVRSDGPLVGVWIDTTGADGTFRFKVRVKEDLFNIHAISDTRSDQALIDRIQAPIWSTTDVGTRTLHKVGAVVVSIPAGISSSDGYLYVTGTEIYREIGSGQDTVIIDEAPPGVLPQICFRQTGDAHQPFVVAENVVVTPGDTVRADAHHVLMVVIKRVAWLYEEDSLFLKRMQNLGYVVHPVDDDSMTYEDTVGMDCILLSSTAQAGVVWDFFTESEMPVVVCPTLIYSQMGMTDNRVWRDYAVYFNDTVNYSFEDSVRLTDIVINAASASHPMAAGLSDTVTIVGEPHYLVWGNPSAEAVIIATVAGNPDRGALFCYEAGVPMATMAAPGKRVGLSYHFDMVPVLTTEGWLLFDAAVQWAIGEQ